MTYNEIFRNMNVHMDRLEEMIEQINKSVDEIRQLKTTSDENNYIENGDKPDDSKKKVKLTKKQLKCCCYKYHRCWPCLQRRRIRKMRKLNRQEQEEPDENS